MQQSHVNHLTPASKRALPVVMVLFLVVTLFLFSPLFSRPTQVHAAGRDPLQWPFASTSIWNMPIGANAQYVAANLPSGQNTQPDGNWFFTTTNSDPVKNLYAPAFTSGAPDEGRCSGSSSQTTLHFPDSGIVNDAHSGFYPNDAAAVLQPDGFTLVQMQPLARCSTGGNVYGYWIDCAGQGYNTSIEGDGLCGAHYGSGLSSIGGEIRDSELQASGNNSIPHALQLEIWDNYLGQCGLTLHGQTENGYRWPAHLADSAACDSGSTNRYKGTNPSLVQGSLLALPPSLTPASLGITDAVGIKMFYALQNYGGYIVDDTGWNDYNIGVDQAAFTDPNYNWFGGTLQNDINALMSNAQIVDNNSPTTIGGGGTLRAPMAPDFGSGSTPTPTPTNTPTSSPTSGGSLSGSVASASTGTYNLTTIGTADWVHWGNGGYPGQDRKSGGNAISSVSTFGSGAATGTWHDASRNFSWSNGTPTGSSTNNQNYIWDNGNNGTGFRFTVPADTTTRTLSVYAGGASGGVSGTLQASLSDNSATAYSSSFGPTGSSMLTNVYTVTYHAASAGQTLTVTLTKAAGSSGTGAPSVDLIAAALQGGGSGSSGTLTGNMATASSSYNLTSVGTSDWAHWGRGNVYGNFDHKASGGSQISNVTTTGSGGNYGSWYDASRSVSWTDGTPTGSVSGDTGYIWSNGAANTGFVFTVPAGTTQHTLVIYAGGYQASTKLTAHLSDGSASDVVLTQSSTGLFSEVYTITFKAASAGQTLTITLLKTGEDGSTNGSADLDSAWLS